MPTNKERMMNFELRLRALEEIIRSLAMGVQSGEVEIRHEEATPQDQDSS